MKVCFTINCMRNTNDFLAYDEFISKGYFQGCELFFPYNVSSEQRDLYTKEVEKLVNKHKDLELVLHLPHGGSNNNFINEDGSVNNETLNRMKDACLYASNFRVSKLTLHLGTAWPNMNRKLLLDKVLNQVKILADFALSFGMFLMIENMPRDTELGYGIKEMKYIMEYLEKDCKNTKFILDTGHCNVSCDKLDDYVIELHDYLYHMHIHDNNGKSDEHKPLHCGNIDFDSYFKTLSKYHYNELHCLEIIFNSPKELEQNYLDVNEYSNYYL